MSTIIYENGNCCKEEGGYVSPIQLIIGGRSGLLKHFKLVIVGGSGVLKRFKALCLPATQFIGHFWPEACFNIGWDIFKILFLRQCFYIICPHCRYFDMTFSLRPNHFYIIKNVF